jgi:ABC-type transporter Mla subunit MlaD
LVTLILCGLLILGILAVVLLKFQKSKKFEPEIDVYVDESGEISQKDRFQL